MAAIPNIPDLDPNSDIGKERSVGLLLASIAMEEFGLAHIINAEAEKLQFVLGTLGIDNRPQVRPSVEELLEINESIERMLRTVILKEIVLGFKLKDVLSLADMDCDDDDDDADDDDDTVNP